MHRGRNLESKLLLLSPAWQNTLHPCKRSSLTVQEIQCLRNFNCASAQCFRPADRAMLLADVREEWGSVAEFEQFVHRTLPAVLSRSKEQYAHRFQNVAAKSFDMLLGDG